RPLRILVGAVLEVMVTVPILAPFPDVSMHVVQPKGVRLQCPDRCSRSPEVSHLLQTGLLIAAVKPGRGACATTILPLGLGGQAVLFALLPAEPFAEGHRIVPAHVHDGMAIGLGG